MHVVFFILICTQVTPQVAAGMPPMTPGVLYGQQTSPYLPQLYTPTSYQSPLVQVSCVADLYVQYFLHCPFHGDIVTDWIGASFFQTLTTKKRRKGHYASTVAKCNSGKSPYLI